MITLDKSRNMSNQNEIDQLRAQIAQTVAQRDSLKLALERGTRSVQEGLRELSDLDASLSLLDSRFKLLWDREHPRNPAPGPD